MSATSLLTDAADHEPPAALLYQLSTAHFVARCLHVLADAGVADHISDSPRPASAIAAEAGVDADALYRMLRVLAMRGIFREEAGGWVHTPASVLLRRDHPASMSAFASMMGDPVSWGSATGLGHTLKTGNHAATLVHPGGAWGFYAEHPDYGRQFDAAMTAKSHGDIALLVGALEIAGAETVADIAGGRGHCLTAVLDAHPHLHGILFDQPGVVASALDHPRMRKVSGDFFKGGLPSADLYLMTNLRAAAPPGARLVVYEMALPAGPEPHPAKVLDILMLAVTGGLERTAEEYAALFRAAGWTPGPVIATPGPMALHFAHAA